MYADDGLPPEAGRHGEPVAGGGVSFRCAACGEVAAVVRMVRAGTAVNMGPPLGEETYDRDGVVVDYWLGTTSWRRSIPRAGRASSRRSPPIGPILRHYT